MFDLSEEMNRQKKTLEKTMKVFKRLHGIAKISDPRSDQTTRSYNVVLSSDFTLEDTGIQRLFFSEATRSKRSLQWSQERGTGEWVNSGLGSKSRKEIIPSAQNSPPPE